MSRKSFCFVLLLSLATLPIAPKERTAAGDEGFYFTDYKAVPLRIKKQGMTRTLLARMERASLRMPFEDQPEYGSGGFVTPRGLAVTASHVIWQQLAKLSTRKFDPRIGGFLAESPSKELPLPGYEISVTLDRKDVTAAVKSAGQPGASPAEQIAARSKKIAEIEEAARNDAAGEFGEVVPLFDGARYALVRYKKYTDVRLVFMPPGAVTEFAGNPPAWNVPHYDFDTAMVRVYGADGKPVDTSHDYLPFSERPTRSGQRVFNTGFVRSNSRTLTWAQMEFLRDVVYPGKIARMDAIAKQLESIAKGGNTGAQQAAQNGIDSIENDKVEFQDYLLALGRKEVVESVQTEEAALQKAALTLPSGQREEALAAWKGIEKVQGQMRRLWARYQLLEEDVETSGLLLIARNLVRLADEQGKPDGERLWEFREAEVPRMMRWLAGRRSLGKEVELAALTAYLDRWVALLGTDDPLVGRVLRGRTTAQVAAQLIKKTGLGKPGTVQKLARGGEGALMASRDPLIQLARLLDPGAREIRQRKEVLEFQAGLLSAKIGEVRMAQPDAYSSLNPHQNTLRLSTGLVKGAGEPWNWQATFRDLYRRSIGDPSIPLPPEMKGKFNVFPEHASVSIAFNADGAPGSSGSMLVSKEGKFIGNSYGNTDNGYSNEFHFGLVPEARNIGTDAAGILTYLDVVHGKAAAWLTREIRAASHTASGLGGARGGKKTVGWRSKRTPVSRPQPKIRVKRI